MPDWYGSRSRSTGRPNDQFGGQDNAAWLRVGCTIGSMRVLTAAEMLVNNRGASVGFFGTRDGDLALRQLLPLGLSSEDLDETVETIAQMAAFTAARISAMGG